MAPASEYGFLTPTPRLFHLPQERGTRIAITLDDLRWRDPDGQEHTLVRGYPTDGLSLPGIARWLGYDPWGAGLRGGLIHDGGYSLHDDPDLSMGDRKACDRRFLLGCKIDYPRMARTYYRFVRAFGWGPWSRNNTMHMAGYIYAVKTGAVDQWITHVLEQYGGEIINLKAADDTSPPVEA